MTSPHILGSSVFLGSIGRVGETLRPEDSEEGSTRSSKLFEILKGFEYSNLSSSRTRPWVRKTRGLGTREDET